MMRSLLFLVLLMAITLSTCSDPPPLRLTSRQRDRLDSMYVDSVKVLNLEMDSICNGRFATELPLMVDSLIQLRLQEEALLREKYEKK